MVPSQSILQVNNELFSEHLYHVDPTDPCRVLRKCDSGHEWICNGSNDLHAEAIAKSLSEHVISIFREISKMRIAGSLSDDTPLYIYRTVSEQPMVSRFVFYSFEKVDSEKADLLWTITSPM